MQWLLLLLLATAATSRAQISATCNTVFLSWPVTRNLICGGADANSTAFLFELLGDGRDAHVSNFLQIFSTAALADFTQADRDQFFSSVMPYLQAQTFTNPPQYVSHGTDHSVRVMNWAIRLQEIPQLANGMGSKYGMSVTQTSFALGIMGLIHDTGYADLAQHQVPKWLHARSSSIFARAIFEANNNLGRRLLEAAGTNTASLYDDLIYAILYHNADVGFCQWKDNNTNWMSQCFFTPSGNVSDPNSATTNLLNGGTNYTRDYVEVYVESQPLAFAVRVADNLDAIRTRLTPVQNDPDMMQYFLRIYQDADLREAVATNNRANISAIRSAARQRARVVSGLTNTTEEQNLVMNRADEQSWLHFYSNWILMNSDIDPSTWSIQVDLYTENTTLSFALHPGPGLYQINRLATSMLTCHLSNTTFLALVDFNFNLPIAGLEGSSYLPLRAFTKQPVYSATGPATFADGSAVTICNPFCGRIMPYLTYSPEQCINDTGYITPNCDFAGFSAVPPFTDLTYPAELMDLQSTNNDLTRLDVGLTVGSAFLFVMLGMIIVFTYLYQKKKQELLGYTHIPANSDI